MTVQSFIKFYS